VLIVALFLMPVATTPSAPTGPSTASKMEDRKRPAVSSTDDLAPPSKRVAVNGSKTKDESVEMKEEGWIEVRSVFTPLPPFDRCSRAISRPSQICAGFDLRRLLFSCLAYLYDLTDARQIAPQFVRGARVAVKCHSSQLQSRHSPRSTAFMGVPALEMMIFCRQTRAFSLFLTSYLVGMITWGSY
jgi:hypothetical protein